MMPETRRKWGNTLQTVGDVAHNAKLNFPIEAIHRKYTFFPTFLFTSGCNKCLQGGRQFDQFASPRGSFFEILHTCSFENHASQRRPGALFPKKDENSIEKSGLNGINTNGTVDGTRNAHPRGPKKQKYTFLRWILQILMCNRYRQHGTFSVTLGWRKGLF